MKKYLSIFLVSLFLLFPFVVRAEGEEGETENEVVSISSINVYDDDVELTVGEEDYELNISFDPYDYTENVIYSSSNESVATVSNGVVHPIAAGKTTITVIGETSGVSTSIYVTVYNKVTDIEVTGIPDKIAVDKSYILTANIIPDNTKETDIYWELDGNDGIVYHGTCYIDGTSYELKDNQACIDLSEEGNYKLEVGVYGTDIKKTFDLTALKMINYINIEVPSTNYDYSDESEYNAAIYLSESKTLQLSIYTEPSDIPQNLTYSIDDTSIATISQTGLVTALKTGVVNVTVTANDSGVSRKIKITIKEKVPTLKKFSEIGVASYDCDTAFMMWYPVEGASKYNIYRSTSKKGKYKLVGSTNENYYENSKLKCGKTYYYKVQAVNSGEKTTSKIMKLKVKPDTIHYAYPETVTDSKVKLEWYKLKVSGYEIYRSTKAKKGYKKIKTVTKASTITFTDKKLKANTKYYYKFRTWKKVGGKKIYSDYSKSPIEVLTAPAAPKVTVSPNTLDSLRIDIKPSKGATHYYLYKGTDKNNVDEFVNSYEGNPSTYIDEDLEFGKTYYYKVTAYNDNWDHSTTSIISRKVTPTTPSLALKKLGGGKVNVSVGTSTGATGYEVYRSTKAKKGFKVINTVSETEREFVNSAKKGKTYYYKVRAYTEKDGIKVYGDYNKVITIKVI